MPPIDLPQRLLQEFSLKQQTELRKIANLIVDSISTPGFKYIEEMGEAEDSGTILSGSEIVATVASEDGDVSGSGTSVLAGGKLHTLSNSTDSVALGGSTNTIDGANQAFVVGGIENLVEGFYTGIVGGDNNSFSDGPTGCLIASASSSEMSGGTNSAIIAAGDSTMTSCTEAVIMAGSECVATASQSLTIGDAANGHRQWALAVGGGKNITGSLSQATVLAGANTTDGNIPTALYMGNISVVNMLPNTVIGMDLVVVATRTSDLASYYFTHSALVKRIGSADPVVVAQNLVDSGGDAALSTVALTVDVVAAGTGPRVLVTGLAATQIRWTAVATITEQQIPV